MGRRKTKKNDTTLINFQVEKNSKNKKWLDAQDNRTLSLNYLIGLAIDQFGNKDLVSYALKFAKKNPNLSLQKSVQVESSTTVQAESKNYVEEEQDTESSSTNEVSSEAPVVDEQKPKKKKIIKSSKKSKPQKKLSYSEQLSKDEQLPPFSGLN
jgi:hypothetical protein